MEKEPKHIVHPELYNEHDERIGEDDIVDNNQNDKDDEGFVS